MSFKAERFDPNFTQHVIDNIGPKCDPRTRLVMSSLIKHIHDFAREIELTNDEWMAGIHFMNAVGQISVGKRKEGQRICDILGLESLVDEMEHTYLAESGADATTSTTVLGPFWSPNAPSRDNGDTIVRSPHKGDICLMHGKVKDSVTGKGIPGAVVDIWQASSNGKYDFQDPENQEDNNLRGKFTTDADGKYYFYCLRPTGYSLPTDGPAGVLLKLLDRHPFRPAHIHLVISQDAHRSITTQLFPRDDPYLATDSVFAVKNDLVVDFTPLEGDSKAKIQLEYNITLAPKPN